MNRYSALTAAVAVIVVAIALLLWQMGTFAAKPGAKTGMDLDCPKCGYHGSITMDKVIAQGTLSSQTGWYYKCPTCSALARVHAPGTPATAPAEPR